MLPVSSADIESDARSYVQRRKDAIHRPGPARDALADQAWRRASAQSAVAELFTGWIRTDTPAIAEDLSGIVNTANIEDFLSSIRNGGSWTSGEVTISSARFNELWGQAQNKNHIKGIWRRER